jgi:hypothetical protein
MDIETNNNVEATNVTPVVDVSAAPATTDPIPPKRKYHKKPRELQQRRNQKDLYGMREISDVFDIPYKVIKRARNHPHMNHLFAQMNSKCYWSQLEPMLNKYAADIGYGVLTPDDDTIEYWNKYKKEMDAKKSELELQELQKRVILREDYDQAIGAIVAAQKKILHARLIVDLPKKVAGLTEGKIAELMTDIVNNIIGELRNLKL